MGKRNMFCAACGSTNLSVYFPTPEPVARQVVEMAEIRSVHDVLEPSAGTGALASIAARDGGYVDCVEIQGHMAQELRGAGIYRSVRHADFLKIAPDPRYDRVIMNPPFENGADIAHVQHAFGFIFRGGVLVSVMSAMAGQRRSRLDKAFAAFLDSNGAERVLLPAGAFKEAGTNVACALIRLARK